jgi:LacI family transcriptional regulator
MAERSRPIRLVDVAERAGVSIATASRSLAGAPGVSPSLADQVRRIAEAMGYVANAHARSLAGGLKNSVGLIVGEIDDPYFSEIASGAIAAAAETGRLVQVCHAGDPLELLAQIRLLRASNVGAMVLAGSGLVERSLESATGAELDAFMESGGRVAVVGRHGFDAPAVLPENVAGGRSIAQHLIDLGHKRVAVLAGPASLTTIADRLEGMLGVFGSAAVTLSHHSFNRQGGAEGARLALADHPDITAIVALSDMMAIGALAAVRGLGVPVPHEISVSGFDDIAVAADVAPSLTTVRLDMAAIGAEAVRLTARDTRVSTTTGHELKVRESTAVARQP